MGNLLKIAKKRRLAILNEVPTIMHLSYTSTTELDLLIQTESGDDWEIDWGDGVWEQYVSSASFRAKTFTNPTAGVARVRSATGRGLVDLYRVQSNVGTWDFDISALSNVSYQVRFNGNMMQLTGDISALSNVAYQVYFNGELMQLTGDISALSNVTYIVRFSGELMELTGNISALSNVTYYVYLLGNMMELTGDISSLSNVTNYVYLFGNMMELTYSSTVWNTVPENTILISLATSRLSTAEVDQLLSDLNAVGSNGTATIDLRHNNGAPSPAGVTDANELRARGYTVLTN